ncbi:NAD-dependent epimerase/dehydratase family protein [Tsuneonella sp. HG249]
MSASLASTTQENFMEKLVQSVFVTGASGYVGHHVAREFVSRGYAVSGLARSEVAAKRIADLGVSPVTGDLEHPGTFRAAALAADVIVHAAFSYSDTGEERSDIDAAATAVLLEIAASDRRARHFVYTSSVFRYGSDEGESVSELSAKPLDPGDWRHAVADRVLAAATEKLRTSVIRLGWVYGSQGGTLPEAASALAGKEVPDEIRANRIPLVEVTDLARLYVGVAAGRGGVFHGCHGRPVTVGELADLATELIPNISQIDEAHEEHFASIFGRDTPAISMFSPSELDRNATLRRALQ